MVIIVIIINYNYESAKFNIIDLKLKDISIYFIYKSQL
ncbi:hypothetical protein A1OE_1477 [Candidatus Endolissoclinum faulkneri L2]|uniref:Uncharacterized protein n=1 Tax=Candidatus Endolissoclinum faulkneri L2 TaxID=1193729 RepID=K7ZDM0_9PROT|nr:hypothetical protein A1OE_1477 [Candidatus Endolissoclinum faulkneri L2]